MISLNFMGALLIVEDVLDTARRYSPFGAAGFSGFTFSPASSSIVVILSGSNRSGSGDRSVRSRNARESCSLASLAGTGVLQ